MRTLNQTSTNPVKRPTTNETSTKERLVCASRDMALAIFAAAALTMLAGCGSDPEEIARIDERERRIGEEQHLELLTEIGGAYDGPEAAYLKHVGEKLAAATDLAGECRFTLVDTEVVNAFAAPGCYIYLTRGLMALLNSEAELAGVLGHELGHIVADHNEQQQERSLLRQLGVLAVALTTESQTLTWIAGGAAELFTLRYSRKHENEADEFAVRKLIAAGYDPYAAADALDALGRHEKYSGQGGGPDRHAMPEWGRTHPLAENRVERVRAAATAAGLRDDELPEREAAFMDEIDGLLYGDGSTGQANRFQPRAIDVVTVREGDTQRRIAAAMATERPLEQLRMLNDLEESEPLRPGERVKLIRFGNVDS